MNQFINIVMENCKIKLCFYHYSHRRGSSFMPAAKEIFKNFEKILVATQKKLNKHALK